MHAVINKKKLGVAIVISDKVNFGIRNIIKDQERYFIMMKMLQ